MRLTSKFLFIFFHLHTVVYGSSDAGQHLYASDKALNAKMKRVAALLNIAEHQAGLKGKAKRTLHAPLDIEGHAVGGTVKHFVLCAVFNFFFFLFQNFFFGAFFAALFCSII